MVVNKDSCKNLNNLFVQLLENQQRLKTALNWLRLASVGVKKSFVNKLVKELVSSSSNSGDLSLQRKQFHQKANQNKVFAHYRWF